MRRKAPARNTREPGASAPSARPGERFVLQVALLGSLADADRRKAKLGFLRRESGIETVSLDGPEKWGRLQVGPCGRRGELAEARDRLQANRSEPMMLKRK